MPVRSGFPDSLKRGHGLKPKPIASAPEMLYSVGMEWDIFIAHAGPDTGIAEKLYERLSAQANVFLDSKNLRLGDRWDEKLQEAQRAALISVILISENADNAYYLQEEIGAAVDLARRDETKHRVVPIYLSREAAESENIPYGLRRLHSLFLESARDIPDAAEKLLQLLKEIDPEGNPATGSAQPKTQGPANSFINHLPDWFRWWQPAAALAVLLILIIALRGGGSGQPEITPTPTQTETSAAVILPPSDTPEPAKPLEASKTPTPTETVTASATPSQTPTPSPTATALPGEDLARSCISNAQWIAVIGGSNPTDCLDLSSIGFTAQNSTLALRRSTLSNTPRSVNGIYTRGDLSSDVIIHFTLELTSITTTGNIDTILMLGFLPAAAPQNLQILDGSFIYVFKGGATSSIKIALKEPGTALTAYKQWSKIQSANFPPGVYEFELQIRLDSFGNREMALTVTGDFGSASDQIKLNPQAGIDPAFFIGYLMEGGASIEAKISDMCMRSPDQTIADACPWVQE